tara:strand:+ start:331 stop:543 length:213 start_codon:yes stop_codon:yes gene_type:complete
VAEVVLPSKVATDRVLVVLVAEELAELPRLLRAEVEQMVLVEEEAVVTGMVLLLVVRVVQVLLFLMMALQ